MTRFSKGTGLELVRSTVGTLQSLIENETFAPTTRRLFSASTLNMGTKGLKSRTFEVVRLLKLYVSTRKLLVPFYQLHHFRVLNPGPPGLNLRVEVRLLE